MCHNAIECTYIWNTQCIRLFHMEKIDEDTIKNRYIYSFRSLAQPVWTKSGWSNFPFILACKILFDKKKYCFEKLNWSVMSLSIYVKPRLQRKYLHITTELALKKELVLRLKYNKQILYMKKVTLTC